MTIKSKYYKTIHGNANQTKKAFHISSESIESTKLNITLLQIKKIKNKFVETSRDLDF